MQTVASQSKRYPSDVCPPCQSGPQLQTRASLNYSDISWYTNMPVMSRQGPPLRAGFGEAGIIRKKTALRQGRGALVMQRLAGECLMLAQPCGAGIEAAAAHSADKLRPGAVNPRSYAYKAIYDRLLSFFAACGSSGWTLVDFASAQCYTSRGSQSALGAHGVFRKRVSRTRREQKITAVFQAVATSGTCSQVWAGGFLFAVCAPGVDAAPLPK